MDPNSNMAPPAQQGTSGLAIAALIVCIVSLCMPLLWPVGVILAIVAIAKTGGGVGGRGLAIGGLVVAVLAVPIYAAIAIPNFIKFQARSKQSEAKVSLKSLWVAEKSYMADKGELTTDRSALMVSNEER